MAEFKDARSRWDARYAATDGFLFGESPNRWLQRKSSDLATGSRVLCVADGEGRNGVFLAGLGHHVTSFDISSVGTEKALSLAARHGVAIEARVCAADAWDWAPASYDAVVAIFIQFASPALRKLIFDGIRRTLKPGGILIIEGYGLRQLVHRTGGPGVAENLYTMPMLLQSFDGWEVLASRDADLEIREGSAHSGMAHSVAAVFRRPPAN